MTTRTATVLGWTGNLLLAVGVVVAHAALLAVILTALFARRHLGTAADVMVWAGCCLGTASACFWLRRQVTAHQDT